MLQGVLRSSVRAAMAKTATALGGELGEPSSPSGILATNPRRRSSRSVALAAAEAAAVKENLATKAEQSRHRRMFGAPCTEAAQRFYAAFEIDEHGFPCNKAAAERMVAKVVGPLGSLSTDQQAAVLTAAIKRPALREAANRAGIGQASLGERIVDRVKSAFTSQGIKRGSLGADIEASVDSFFNLAPPTPNEEVMQRGKHAKKQKAAGGEAKRVGQGIDEETRKLVLDFYIGHPSIKRSPMKSDMLQMKDANGEKVLVAKLLSEVSLTDVSIDFEKKRPRAAQGARVPRAAAA
eukprot:jgi/Chrpa1/9093/Chrysochromulina_OHIO_Genome00017919-RA